MKITAADIEVLARTVYGEARGEIPLGKLAVAWVIVNRAKRARSGPAAAALKSTHFSTWNNARGPGGRGDANQLAMMTADLSDPVYGACMIAALQAAHGLKPDPTGGARHYHARGARPKWAKDKPYETIGRHRFYRGIR